MNYWAHSDPSGLSSDAPGNRWQLLKIHLRNVSVLAERLARESAPDQLALHQMASMSGLLHDYGKYSSCFQAMICSGRGRCPHSIYGAIAARQFGLKTGESERDWAMPVVRAIAAHHGGLRDDSSIEPETRPTSGAAPTKALRDEAKKIWPVAKLDQPGIVRACLAPPPLACRRKQDLLTRMLLSCLVDADRLDTAGRADQKSSPLRAEERLKQLLLHLDGLHARAVAGDGNSDVLAVREQVQELCRMAAQGSARLLSLAVPTGGGKTLAAMRFALERAAVRPDDARRIIVVIPYLSIIEQNAKVYRKVFGEDAIFEHHSGAVYALAKMRNQSTETDYYEPRRESDNDAELPLKRLETENWDAPVLVTTSVRFFESLFSNHPSDLRRVHNIARSIIVLDEVQTLPRRLLAPLLDMLRELTEDWGCTVVMATATQPAFEARLPKHESYAWPKGTVTPIIPPAIAAEMHSALQRVHIEWRLSQPMPWNELADEVLTHPQALCVVNLRRHAALLYDALCAKADATTREGIFHLSTRMCAQHRLDVLAVIRERLAAKLPCVVVSTQLIEAGVDVDFPIAFRALGPLDAIIQVAGRVDREGRLTAAAGKPAGRLIVFATEDGNTPPYEYKEATAVTAGLARDNDLQTDDLDAMQSYFERYYGDADDQTRGKHLAHMRDDNQLAFATLADQFEMIHSRTKDVFVPYKDGKKLLDQLRESGYMKDWKLLRKLQRYSVGLQPWEFEEARKKTLYEVFPGTDIWACSEPAYEVDGRGLLTDQTAGGLIQ